MTVTFEGQRGQISQLEKKQKKFDNVSLIDLYVDHRESFLYSNLLKNILWLNDTVKNVMLQSREPGLLKLKLFH